MARPASHFTGIRQPGPASLAILWNWISQIELSLAKRQVYPVTNNTNWLKEQQGPITNKKVVIKQVQRTQQITTIRCKQRKTTPTPKRMNNKNIKKEIQNQPKMMMYVERKQQVTI